MFNLYNGFSSFGMDLPRVNGIESAQKYPTVHSMPPNSRVALFDENDDIMYIVSTDSANTIGVKRFRFVEEPLLTPEQVADSKYVTIDEFNRFKEEMINVQQSIFQQQPNYQYNRRPKPKQYRSHSKQSSAGQEYVVNVEEQQQQTGNDYQFNQSESFTPSSNGNGSAEWREL